MGLFNKKIKRPHLMKLNDENRYKYIEKWWEMSPSERVELITSQLDKVNIEYPYLGDLSNHELTTPHIIKAYHLEEDVKNGYFDDINMYAESLEDPNIDMLLEVLLPERATSIDGFPFSELTELDEVIYVYPDIWINMLKLAGIKLKRDAFIVKVDGKTPALNADPEFKKIEISFTYKNRPYKYKYKRHWISTEALDFNVIQDIEEFLANNDVSGFFLKVEGNLGDSYFLLPAETVEALDKYIDHIG